jgi:hypothetical protein
MLKAPHSYSPKEPNHLACAPNRSRQELSAAYWLDRSPWLPSRLEQILHGQSTLVTFPGNRLTTSANEFSFVNAPLLSYYMWTMTFVSDEEKYLSSLGKKICVVLTT